MTRPRLRAYAFKGPRTEAGAALLALLLVLIIGGSYALLNDAKSLAQRAKLEEAHKTTAALAEAKAALIGYAVSRQLNPDCSAPGNNCARPGELPCPDRTNNGADTGNCGAADGSTGGCASGAPPEDCYRLGHLPWKTLKLPDIRDGSGERLWYAVATNFKTDIRSLCNPLLPDPFSGCLNSDAKGTITVHSRDGMPAYDASDTDPLTSNGVAAVIIAPGKVLRRQDGIDQVRTCVGVGCSSDDPCPGTPSNINVPTCNPRNYLDVALGEDNATFDDVLPRTDGFIQGDIVDSDGTVIVNDRVLPITYQDLIPPLEQRVVGEVLTCLRKYATDHGGRYPWAAKHDDILDGIYNDEPTRRFGRVPDPPFADPPPMGPVVTRNRWANRCQLLRTSPVTSAQWWLNWKQHIFYGVAEAYQSASGTPSCGITGTCLTVNRSLLPPEENREIIVIASGRRLSGVALGQPRDSDQGNIAYYLEDTNAHPVPPDMDELFTAEMTAGTINDVVCKRGTCPPFP